MSGVSSAARSSAGTTGFRGVVGMLRMLAVSHRVQGHKPSAVVGTRTTFAATLSTTIAAALVTAMVAASSVEAAKTVDRFFPSNGASGGLGGHFNDPRGVAISRAPGHVGEIYVADRANNRIQRFAPSGTFQRAWGVNVVQAAGTGDTAGGDFEICTVASQCQAGTVSATPNAADTLKNGGLSGPAGVAINHATGDVYVRDTGNRRINQYTANGVFVRSWGWNVDADAAGTAFEICEASARCQAGVSGAGAGQLGASGGGSTGTPGIAVAPPGAPNAGNVYVADPGAALGNSGFGRRLLEFSTTGAFIRLWGWDVNQTNPSTAFEFCTAASGDTCKIGVSNAGNGGFGNNSPHHLAADANGIVYASDVGQSGRIQRFDTTQTSSGTFGSPGSFVLAPILSTGGGGALTGSGQGALAVDPITNDLFAARGSSDVFELDTSANPATVTSSSVIDIHAPGSGLTPLGMDVNGEDLYFSAANSVLGNPAHRVYIADDDGASGALDVSLDPPTGVTASEASFSGSINPGGFPVDYRFEFSKTGVEGDWTPVQTPNVTLGDGTSPVDIPVNPSEGHATDLEACTLYRVRIVAKRGFGNGELVSPELTFLTDCIPPDATTGPVVSVDDNSAILPGTLNPNGTDTAYHFEYGRTVAYGATAPVPAAAGGAAATPSPVSQQLVGLSPDTVYHYRLCATNAYGLRCGADGTFATLPVPGSGRDRAYERVSPPAVGGVGPGTWYNGVGAAAAVGAPAHFGDRFIVNGRTGSMLSDGGTAWGDDHALAERTPKGWTSRAAMSLPNSGSVTHRLVPLRGAALDLSTFTVDSNDGNLKMFPEIGDWSGVIDPAFVGDWQARWEIFSLTDENQLPPGITTGGSNSETVVSADGSAVVGFGSYHGVAGPSDPTDLAWPDRVAGQSVYLDDVSGGLSNSFPGAGVRSLVNSCSTGTVVPTVVGGLLTAGPCSAPGKSQLVTIEASGGSFSLDFGGEVTAPVLFDAPAAGPGSVAEALEALPSLEPGDVTVGGGPVTGKPYYVRFTADLGDVDELTVDDSALITPTTAAVDTVDVAPLISSRGAALHRAATVEGDPVPSSLKNIVSRDGSRTFFLSPDPVGGGPVAGCDPGTGCPPQLYVRQRNDDGTVSTRWLSQAEPGLLGSQSAQLTGSTFFEGATPDGDVVFFRTNSPLTVDDPNAGDSGAPSNSSWDLYRYELPPGPDGDSRTPDADPAGGTLTRISGGLNGAGDCNSPQDAATSAALRWVSDDGDRAYFTCAAALPAVGAADNGGLTTQGGSVTTTDTANLYLWEAGESWRFVARLPRAASDFVRQVSSCASRGAYEKAPLGEADLKVLHPKIGLANNDGNCVRGTADGEFITFWTDGRLTSDDPDATSGDIYAYDSEADRLTRISRPQGGDGLAYECSSDPTPVTNCYGDPGFHGIGRNPLPMLGVVTEPPVAGQRTAFFQSRSRLVPEDTDGAYDVYQWEDGHLSLVSTGVSATDGAFYKGNSADGKNVYFATRDRLTWQDSDSVLDIYVARLGGGIPEPVLPPVCGAFTGFCQGGGAGLVSGRSSTSSPAGDDNVRSGARKALSIAGLDAKARRRAVRTGRLALRVRTTGIGRLSVVATGRLGKRKRVLARASKRVTRPGVTTVHLRLSAPTRRALGRGRGLSVSIRVGQMGAISRSITVRLRGARP